MNKSVGFALRSAIVGLVLGLLGGLLGGVDFATILLRMVLAAAILGGLGFGLFFVVQKYIPELLTEITIGQSSDDLLDSGLGGELNSSGTGERVNIVVDDETQPNDQAKNLRTEMQQGATNTADPGIQEAELNQDFGTGQSPDSPEASDAHGVGSGSGVANIFTGDDDNMVQEVQEDGGKSSSSMEPRNDDDFYAGVDNLPDISGFSDSFHDKSFNDDDEIIAGEDTPEDDDISASLSGLSGTDGAGSEDNMNDDPKIYAAAIRTALKKG